MIAAIFTLFESEKANVALDLFIMLLIGFLLGYFVAWQLIRNKYFSLKDEVDDLNEKLKTVTKLEKANAKLKAEADEAKASADAYKSSITMDFERVRSEKKSLQTDYNRISKEIKTMYPEEEVLALRRKITEMENASPTEVVAPVESGNDEEISKLKAEITRLKNENKALGEVGKTAQPSEGMVPVGELDKLRVRMQQLENEKERLLNQRQNQPKINTNEDGSRGMRRLREENEKLALQKDQFLSEKLRLEAELADCKGGKVKIATKPKAAPKAKEEVKETPKHKVKEEIKETPKKKAAPKAKEEVKEKPKPKKAAPKPKAKKKTLDEIESIVDDLSIEAASEADKDDLKLISGVGPFIEKKLNKLGIYTFNQISQFTGDDVQKVTDAIQFFPGRIQRDDWMSQAKKLMSEK